MKIVDYKYYTPYLLSKKLVSLLSDYQFNNAIDICCGSWNLLKATQEQWPQIQITGVDIDSEAENEQIENSKFYREDGRTYSLKCLENNLSYDLILANPPFGYLTDDNRIYNNNDKIGDYKPIVNKRYEVEMLIANLILAKQNSVVLAILPETYVCGDSNKKFRSLIASKFAVEYIIKLPIDTFQKGNIKTCGIVLKKTNYENNIATNYCTVIKNGDCWEIIYEHNIPYSNIKNGIWNKKVFCHNSDNANNSIDLIGFRGNISSNSFSNRKTKTKVLHCANKIKESDWYPSEHYINIKNNKAQCNKYIDNGDIIINRIGKGAGYWCEYKGEKLLVSDCLIVLKTNNTHFLQSALTKLSNKRKCLDSMIKGLSTPYIAMNDILDAINEVV